MEGLDADARHNLAFCFPIDIIRNLDISLNNAQRARVTSVENLDIKLRSNRRRHSQVHDLPSSH